MAKRKIKKKTIKSVKKKIVKKKSKTPTKKRAAAKKTLPPGITPEKQVPEGKLAGLVEDYFSHVNVIALTIKVPIAVGDTIRIKGHTTDITQKVESMQIEHAPVQSAAKGAAIGIRIIARARKGDAVYKI